MTTTGNAAAKMPKDALVMMAILREAGVNSYDPRVIDQLLEFSYKYITNVLDDARAYCNHAKKKSIDLDDVKLAAQMQLEQNYTSPPSREMLAEIARPRNSQPLPAIKTQHGVRLPPDRYCLTAANYRLKLNKPAVVGGSGERAGTRMMISGERMATGGTKVAVVPHKTTSQGSSLQSSTSSSGHTTLHMTMPKFKVHTESSTPTARLQLNVGPPSSADASFSDSTLAGKRKLDDQH